MQIGELAKRAGVSHRTIHYYERIGLLPPARRAPAGHRRYDEDALERLGRIAAFKRLGLSLDEIAEVISAARSEKANVKAQERGLEMLNQRLAETEAHLRELFGLRQDLIADISRLERQLQETKRV